jgi:CubicO group peptidase (beta-lactamase class C family)
METYVLPRSASEAQGISSAAILAFVNAIEQNNCELHSFMLLRHGRVVAEGWWSPYTPQRPHMLFSLSKSFASTAVGLAVAEGRLSVHDRVLSFFPDDAPAQVSENLAAMRVHDLLAMATGHAEDTTRFMFEREDGNWAKGFLARPVDYTPGTQFVYNSGATYMLSAIVQKLTGMALLDYLTPRLLEPLGIEGATWESCPRGINVGGWGLKIKTDDIARFGQMYLQKGCWQERQLVPQDWVAEATARQVDNWRNENVDWAQGYGYQFWRCQHDAYRGDGAFGQYCVVMPDQDAVLAVTAGVSDMQAVLTLAWEHLLPAMQPGALPHDHQAQADLERRLAALALAPVQGESGSLTAARVSGNRYHFEPNDQKMEWVALTVDGSGVTISWRDELGEHNAPCGSGEWLLGSAPFRDERASPIAASGAWTDAETYQFQIRYLETPFCGTTTLRFIEGIVLYQLKMNVGFGPTELPQLVGRLESAR